MWLICVFLLLCAPDGREVRREDGQQAADVCSEERRGGELFQGTKSLAGGLFKGITGIVTGQTTAHS